MRLEGDSIPHPELGSLQAVVNRKSLRGCVSGASSESEFPGLPLVGV